MEDINVDITQFDFNLVVVDYVDGLDMAPVVICRGTHCIETLFPGVNNVGSGEFFPVVEIDVVTQVEGDVLPVVCFPFLSQHRRKSAVLVGVDQCVINHSVSHVGGTACAGGRVEVQHADRGFQCYSDFFGIFDFLGSGLGIVIIGVRISVGVRVAVAACYGRERQSTRQSNTVNFRYFFMPFLYSFQFNFIFIPDGSAVR